MEILIPDTHEQEVAAHYKAALDSVRIVNTLMSKEGRTESDNEAIARNVEHLQLMLAKDYWTTQDLTPFKHAITLAMVP